MTLLPEIIKEVGTLVAFFFILVFMNILTPDLKKIKEDNDEWIGVGLWSFLFCLAFVFVRYT